ncbi:MAG: coenzyme F420-0:L-glutamate ligase [Rhizobiales bacterium]|nr:coenzyme F420-0:L-glutamate ligase [Hyphomicrobiales bacterium]
MKSPERLTLGVVPGIPLIQPGDDLGGMIAEALDQSGMTLADGDIVVVTQKIVSKAQGRSVELAGVVPSPRALKVAAAVDKDARLVEVILSESVRIVRQHPGVLIVEHRNGFIMANAGADRSNVSDAPGRDVVLLLPNDPDAAAQDLRVQFETHFGKSLGVVISDSFGRPWRQGTVGVALGAAGLPALNDLRGRPDLFGHPLEVSVTALADEVASAASLLMGQANEGYPVVVVSGFAPADRDVPARALVRPAAQDLFR